MLGQSGSGKTTFLHLMAGLLTPLSGKVMIKDVDFGKLKTHARDKFRGKNIGMIFQKPHFVRALTVEENLMLAQKFADAKQDKNAIRQILTVLGIEAKMQSKTEHLSQGEQQRVAIARAVINHPAVIFADEPTSALDDHNTVQVIELLKRQANDIGASLVVVTHDNRLKEAFEQKIVLS